MTTLSLERVEFEFKQETSAALVSAQSEIEGRRSLNLRKRQSEAKSLARGQKEKRSRPRLVEVESALAHKYVDNLDLSSLP